MYCDDHGEYRTFCNICDNLCREGFYEKHLKSSTYFTKVRER